MQITDLFGTEIQLHPESNPNPHCQILLNGIGNGTILPLLAIETTEGWQERIAPLNFLSKLSGREIMVYEEATHALLWYPVQDAAAKPELRKELGQAFLLFMQKFGIVPQGKVIPIN